MKYCTSCGSDLLGGGAFCHSCGAKVAVQAPPPGPGPETLAPKCPQCRSSHTQTVKMLVMTGSQQGSVVGVGASLGGGVGVAGASTASAHALARSLDPGSVPGFTLGIGCVAYIVFMVGLIGAMLVIEGELSGIVALAIAAAIVWAMWTNYKQQMKTWDSKKRIYDNAWICLQCGSNWVPEKN